MASRLFPFLEKKHSKIRKRASKHFEGLAALSPIQRDGGRRSRPGVNPFISALTVARCPATFPGVWPQLRDTLSTSWSVGQETGAFIYALSADENRPALAAPRHTSTALFSCRFKCPCPPRRQRYFTATPTERITHYTLLRKVVCQWGVAPFGNPHKKSGTLPFHGAHTAFSCLKAWLAAILRYFVFHT